MLQVSPTTSEVSLIGRESPPNVFACGIDGALYFSCFRFALNSVFMQAMSYATCNKYTLDYLL
jgi:hypothetical protein